MINTKVIEQVINNLLKENATLKDRLDTQSKHGNEMQNVKREFEKNSRLTNDQLSRANGTIENKIHEITNLVSNKKRKNLKKQFYSCVIQLLV